MELWLCLPKFTLLYCRTILKPDALAMNTCLYTPVRVLHDQVERAYLGHAAISLERSLRCDISLLLQCTGCRDFGGGTGAFLSTPESLDQPHFIYFASDTICMNHILCRDASSFIIFFHHNTSSLNHISHWDALQVIQRRKATLPHDIQRRKAPVLHHIQRRQESLALHT